MKLCRFFTLLVILFFSGCGGSGKTVRIAVDPMWYPVNFGPQQAYVNGFVDELLLEVAGYNGITFEKVSASGSALYEGLKAGKFDAVISSLETYIFNTAQYDFSQNILSLGPVLIAPQKASPSLETMKGSLVGFIAGDPVRTVLEKYPTLVLRTFVSVPDLLNAVVTGEVEVAVLDHVPATRYVTDLYAGVLKIVSAPLTSSGLHVVTLKGSSIVSSFDRALERLQKKKRLASLRQKWNLST